MWGQHDDVAALQVGPAPRVHDEVQRLGGVLGEDHLVRLGGVDEPPAPAAGALEQVVGFDGEGGTRCG